MTLCIIFYERDLDLIRSLWADIYKLTGSAKRILNFGTR
jgi:hypothetical protein